MKKKNINPIPLSRYYIKFYNKVVFGENQKAVQLIKSVVRI
jgi:hypothetical protein